MDRSNSMEQFSRYVIVGLMSNLAAFVLYLGLTAIKLHYVLAMTLVYVVALFVSFRANKAWTFGHHKTFPNGRRLLAKYLFCYFVAFIFNAIALLLLVEKIGFQHEIVQAILIPTIAIALFLSQRYWVFVAHPKVTQGKREA